MIIHTVYKPEENLDYLNDWLNHHSKIGVDHFYMYDNGGGGGNWGMLKENIPITHNKNGYKHRYSVSEARKIQFSIFEKYNVSYVKWDPRDSNGNILYNWKDSVLDLLSKKQNDLCAFIDIDEFIIKKEDFKTGRMNGIKYRAMHEYKSIHDCHDKCIIPQDDTKCILDLNSLMAIKNTNFDMHFRNLDLPVTSNYYNHYNHNKLRHKKFEPLNPNMKEYNNISFEKCFVFDPNPGLLK